MVRGQSGNRECGLDLDLGHSQEMQKLSLPASDQGHESDLPCVLSNAVVILKLGVPLYPCVEYCSTGENLLFFHYKKKKKEKNPNCNVSAET